MSVVPIRIWTFAAVLAIIAILGLGWLLGVSPQLTAANTADNERVQVDAQNQQAQVALLQLQADAERLPELEARFDELSAEFPSSVEYERVIEELFGEVGSAGLVLTSLTIDEPTIFDPDGTGIGDDGTIPAGTLLEVVTRVQVQGGVDGMLAFVQSLQESARFAVVDSVSFSGGETPTTSITLRVYVIASEALTPGVVAGDTPVDEPAAPGEAPADEGDDGVVTDEEAPVEG